MRIDNCREWLQFIKLNYIFYFGWKCVIFYRYGIYFINFVLKQKKKYDELEFLFFIIFIKLEEI